MDIRVGEKEISTCEARKNHYNLAVEHLWTGMAGSSHNDRLVVNLLDRCHALI